MFIEKAMREELKELSKFVFGVESRYQKFLQGGMPELITRKVMENIPGVDGAPNTEKEVTEPVLAANGTKQYKTKYYTPEEVVVLLRDMKVKKEQFLAMIKKQQDEAAAEAKAKKDLEDAKKMVADLAGSAVV